MILVILVHHHITIPSQLSKPNFTPESRNLNAFGWAWDDFNCGGESWLSRRQAPAFHVPAVSWRPYWKSTFTQFPLPFPIACIKSHSLCSATACWSRKKKRGCGNFAVATATLPGDHTQNSFQSFPCLFVMPRLTHFYVTHECCLTEDTFPVFTASN